MVLVETRHDVIIRRANAEDPAASKFLKQFSGCPGAFDASYFCRISATNKEHFSPLRLAVFADGEQEAFFGTAISWETGIP